MSIATTITFTIRLGPLNLRDNMFIVLKLYLYLAILCALLGMVKWPFGKIKWPPTRETRESKGHFESPGLLYIFLVYMWKLIQFSEVFFALLGSIQFQVFSKKSCQQKHDVCYCLFVFMLDTFQPKKCHHLAPPTKKQHHNHLNLTLLDPTSRCQPYEPSGFKTNKHHAAFRVVNS